MSDSVLKECLKELQEMSEDEVIKKCKELNLYSNEYSNEKYKDDSFEVISPVNIRKNKHRHVNPGIRITPERLVGDMVGRRGYLEELVGVMGAAKGRRPAVMTLRKCVARPKRQGNKSKTPKATK